jgi:hypothetical protein
MITIGKTKTVIETDYRELTKVFLEVYGRDPEIVASEEWSNGESQDIDADGELDEWDLQSLAKFLKTGKASFGITQLLLNDLVRGGKIVAGTYLVGIYW